MRKILFWIIAMSGLPWFFREILNRNKVTILLFHAPNTQIAEKQLKILNQKYNIIPLRQYIDILNNQTSKTLPKKSLVITYDDGAKENYLLKPILEKYNIPITIFLCSSIVGTNRHYWWTALPEDTASAELENMSNDARLAFLEKRQFQQSTEYDNRQALSQAEIDELRPFVDFQSHTCFHPNLPQCTDRQSYEEIYNSRIELQSKFELDIYAIAFPNGAYTEREISIVKDSEYSCSLTTHIGFNELNEDKFYLKRIDILDSADANEVIIKSSGAWHFIQQLQKKVLFKK